MTSITASSSSLLSSTIYRPHQSQTSNSVNQSFPSGETSKLNDSFSSTPISISSLITVVYSRTSLSQENQQLLLNSYASCRRLLDHVKQVIGAHQCEMIDLMDSEGKLKELNGHLDEYATQYLASRNTYYLLKVGVDSATGEKHYTSSFNLDLVDQKVGTTLSNSLNTLNKSQGKTKRQSGISKQNSTSQPSSNAFQSKTKRLFNRKQT